MTISREHLNNLYHEFYGLINDSLKLHIQDKVTYKG